MQNESKRFLPRFSSIDVDANLYCCHHIWIGPSKIPTEAIFKLHDKYKLYQGIEGQFIPTLCLNEEAVCNLQNSNVPIELVKLGDFKLPIDDLIIQKANKLEHCKYVLKIDLYNNGTDIAYIPVFILEDLYESIKFRLDSLVKINNALTNNDAASEELFSLRKEAQKAYDENKDFFKEEHAMFNYIKDTLISYLYNEKQYRAASDLIGLLLLVLKPGCYIDIEDMNMKRLPLKSDFTDIDLLTKGSENYLIFCVKEQKIADVLTCMYTNIRKHMETTTLEYFGGYYGDGFVNYIAGYSTWSRIMGMNHALNINFKGKNIYTDALIAEIAENIVVSIYNTSGRTTASRNLAFLVNKLLGNEPFKHIVVKEIQQLSQQDIEELTAENVTLFNQPDKLKA